MIKLFIAILFFSTGLIGCTSTYYTTGTVSYEPDSSETVSYRYDVKLVTPPTMDVPSAKFKLEKYPVYAVDRVTTSTEMVADDKLTNSWLAIAFGLSTGAAVLASDQPGGQKVGELLLMPGSAFFLLFGTYQLIDVYNGSEARFSNGTPTGRVKLQRKSTSQTVQGIVSEAWLESPDVTASCNEKTVRVKSSGGEFSLDPINDFGLGYLTDPSPVRLRISVNPPGYSQDFYLDPKKWTRERMRVTAENAALRQSASRTAKKVGDAVLGEEYPVKGKRNGFFALTFHGRDSWISSGDCETFWSAKNRLDPNRLPRLVDNIRFTEPTGDGILHADEIANMALSITNTGQGYAYGLTGAITPSSLPGLVYKSFLDIGDIAPGETKHIDIPLSALKSIATGTVSMKFSFKEANGFEPDPMQITFHTQAYVPPKLIVADVGVESSDGGSVIEPGMVVTVTARVQNTGLGEAQGVKAAMRLGDNVFLAEGSRTDFNIGDLAPGQYRDVKFKIYTNNRAAGVPVYVDLTEKYGSYGLSGYKLPLAFDKPMERLREIVIQPKESGTPDIEVAKGLSIGVDTEIPETGMHNANAVALILAISSYQDPTIPTVKYAKNDARVLREYLIKTLGYSPDNILPHNPDDLLTYGQIRTYIQKVLPSYLRPDGSSDLFVYYTGHGAPSTTNHEAYLIPWDCNPNFVSNDNAYEMKQFYIDIEKLNARKKVIVVDACFSGQAGNGESLIKYASTALLRVNNPLIADSNTVIFQSSGPDQVSNWYDEKRHGMFTYFFLKGLQGSADLNGDGKITAGEMIRYIDNPNDGLPYYSNRLYQRPQDAQLEGDDTMVIERVVK